MKKSNFPFILGFGIIIMMIALSQNAKAQTSFTKEEIELLKKSPSANDEPLNDNMRCVFDNDQDGVEDTSFNMTNACISAFERALSPRIVTFDEMKEVLTKNSKGGILITTGVWEIN